MKEKTIYGCKLAFPYFVLFVLPYFFGGITPALADTVPPPGGATFDTTVIDQTTCLLFDLITGPYGALLMAAAGLSAVIAATQGSYRGAYTFLAVGIACFITPAIVTLYFGDVTCTTVTGPVTTTTFI